MRVDVAPELIRWAKERSRVDGAVLAGRFPKLDEWEQGQVAPTLKQLEDFAKATQTPVGYLFLDSPPAERCQSPTTGRLATPA